MANWSDVQAYLNDNFKMNAAMQVMTGSGSFAAEVDVLGGNEVVIVFDEAPVIQFVTFINSSKPINVEQLLTSTKYFGIRKNSGQNGYVMQHMAWLETIDAPELNFPINLMAQEARRIKNELGLI